MNATPTHAPNDPKAIVHQIGPGRLGHLKCRTCGETRGLGPSAVSLPEWIHTLERFAAEHDCESKKEQAP